MTAGWPGQGAVPHPGPPWHWQNFHRCQSDQGVAGDRTASDTGARLGPNLAVCVTNHALDQFLEGLLDAGVKVVRAGGRCADQLVPEFACLQALQLRVCKHNCDCTFRRCC